MGNSPKVDFRDMFNKKYNPLSEQKQQAILDLKNRAEDIFFKTVNDMGDERSIEIVRQKIEEFVMFAAKSICDSSK